MMTSEQMQIERRSINDRAEWLAWRRQDVTASAVGGLFGCHPYTTALRLYVEKSGVEFDEKENNAMKRGRWLEPAVAKAVSELEPEWKLEAPGIYLRDPELRLGATPDFFIRYANDLGVLQCKTCAPSVYEREWLGGTEIPFWIQLQTLTEMMLSEAEFGAVAVMLVDPHNIDCKILEVPRHHGAEAKITAAVKQFWLDVENGREPDADYGKDAELIKLLAPREVEGKTVDLSGSNELPTLLEQREQIMQSIKDYETRKEEIETQLRFQMRDAERAVGIDGWSISWRTHHRDRYIVPAKDVRILRINRRNGGKHGTKG